MTAFCFVRPIETLSHPSMSKRGAALASYLDLVITVEARFCNVCGLSFNFKELSRSRFVLVSLQVKRHLVKAAWSILFSENRFYRTPC